MQKLIGFVLIIAAMGLAAYAWMLSKEMADEQHAHMQQVVVASVRITAGSIITADKLQLMEFPTRPPGSYGDVRSVVGTVTPVDIAAGEPLLAERIAASANVPLRHLEANERAVAVRVDEVVAVGNRLAPGDRVDVFATFRRNNDEVSDSHARLLLAGLRVLAFGNLDAPEPKKGSNARAVSDTPRTAVLAVPLIDVDKLALAAEAGRLLLALRPEEAVPAAESSAGPVAPAGKVGVVPAAVQSVSLRELLGARERAAQPRPAAQPGAVGPEAKPQRVAGVQVMHGLKEKTVQVSTKQNGAGQ